MKGTILDEILKCKRARLADQLHTADAEEMRRVALAVRDRSVPHCLRKAVSARNRINIIAEFKRASPSKGVINDSLDVEEIAQLYRDRGAAAISVLTEKDFFRGSIADLITVKETVALPVLFKDFIIDEFQIYEAASAGADAVLLIVAALHEDQLLRFRHIIENDLQMDALVEVHSADELEIAKRSGARIFGVNNRNLRTFDVSLDVSRQLIAEKPPNMLMIAESGISQRTEIEELHALGFDGFLIGESLMREPSNLAEFTKRATAKVKICGITNLEDALHSTAAGADFLGFNFYATSPRHITPEVAGKISASLPPGIATVGVFVDEDPENVVEVAKAVGLDAVQLHGSESPDYAARIRSLSTVEIIKAFRVASDFDPAAMDSLGADAVLLDSFESGIPGGTGRVFDWRLAEGSRGKHHKIFLAGGLSPENVADAIRSVRPYAVDACSLLESRPGIKDHDKVTRFINNARCAR